MLSPSENTWTKMLTSPTGINGSVEIKIGNVRGKEIIHLIPWYWIINHVLHPNGSSIKGFMAKIASCSMPSDVTGSTNRLDQVENAIPGSAIDAHCGRPQSPCWQNSPAIGRDFRAGNQTIQKTIGGHCFIEHSQRLLPEGSSPQTLSQQGSMGLKDVFSWKSQIHDPWEGSTADQWYCHPFRGLAIPDLNTVCKRTLGKLGIVQPDQHICQCHLSHKSNPGEVHGLRDGNRRHAPSSNNSIIVTS